MNDICRLVINNQPPGGDPGQNEEILNNLCPANCSGKGVCTDGMFYFTQH